MAKSIFDEMSEEEIWTRYKKTHSLALRDAIVRQYMPLVKYVAGKISVGMPSCVDYDDLVCFGQFGLLDAVSKYNMDRNIKFKTYAVTRIRGAILDELRQLDWVPRSVRSKTKEIEDAIAVLEARLGRPATDSEVAKEMSITEDEYHQALQRVAGTSIMSLNEVWSSGDESETTAVVDTIEAPSSLNPDIMAEREDIKRVIIEAISALPDKEKKVILLYYNEDLTFKEIGKVLEVSESRVSQLHTKAILRLRSRLTNLRRGIV